MTSKRSLESSGFKDGVDEDERDTLRSTVSLTLQFPALIPSLRNRSSCEEEHEHILRCPFCMEVRLCNRLEQDPARKIDQGIGSQCVFGAFGFAAEALGKRT